MGLTPQQTKVFASNANNYNIHNLMKKIQRCEWRNYLVYLVSLFFEVSAPVMSSLKNGSWSATVLRFIAFDVLASKEMFVSTILSLSWATNNSFAAIIELQLYGNILGSTRVFFLDRDSFVYCLSLPIFVFFPRL